MELRPSFVCPIPFLYAIAHIPFAFAADTHHAGNGVQKDLQGAEQYAVFGVHLPSFAVAACEVLNQLHCVMWLWQAMHTVSMVQVTM